MGITINDNFKIYKKHLLSGEDYIALAQMYLPIIGIDSYGLYSLLFTLKENEIFSYKKLIDALNLTNISFIEKAFSKLEAVSLIEVYFNEQKGYLYNLKTPLSTTSFLQNSLLSSFLISQIGEVEVDKIRSNNEKLNVKSYKEITRSFDEVYDVTTDSIESIFSKIFKAKNKVQVKVNNPDFDYIFFKMNFDSSFIDPKILDDEEFKQQILTISYNYKLNEEEMKDVIIKTMNIDKDLKYADISKNARIFYQQKNKSKETRFVTKEADTFINSSTDDDTFRFIEKVENTAPIDLLQELNGGIKPSVSELKIIEDLVNNTSFPMSVINIMILLVCNEKEGELPGYNYFEKIANTWARAKIKTPLDVINYINKDRSKKTEVKQTVRNKKVASVPDWYGKYEKQLQSLPQQEKLTPEEIDQILRETKDFD